MYKKMGMLSEDVDMALYTQKIAPVLKPLQHWLVEPFLQERYDFSTMKPFPIIPPQESLPIANFFAYMHRDQVYFNRFYIGVLILLEKIGATVRTTNSFIK